MYAVKVSGSYWCSVFNSKIVSKLSCYNFLGRILLHFHQNKMIKLSETLQPMEVIHCMA